jgi:hypothetical protein
MTTVADIVRDGWSALPGAFAWLLVVMGISKVVFRSFVAAELSAWLQKRNAGRINELKRADWELRRNTKFQTGMRADDDMTALPPLTEAERAERIALVEQLRSNTLPIRALAWLLGCGFCQAAWAAVICFTVTSRDWWQLAPTCLAYAAITGWLGERFRAAGQHASGPNTQPRTCGG